MNGGISNVRVDGFVEGDVREWNAFRMIDAMDKNTLCEKRMKNIHNFSFGSFDRLHSERMVIVWHLCERCGWTCLLPAGSQTLQEHKRPERGITDKKHSRARMRVSVFRVDRQVVQEG